MKAYTGFAAAALVLAMVSVETLAQACMNLEWKRGRPYDYYATETRVKTGTYKDGLLSMVEGAHFTLNVQLLRKGKSSAQPSDLVFVLSSIPNHPAALDAYSRYESTYRSSSIFRNQADTNKPVYSTDCFFSRATEIFPDYAETYKVWGMHLYRNQKYKESIDMFSKASSMNDNSADLHYYMGLSFLALGDLENAQVHADIAYGAGYPLQGLKKGLSGHVR